jgi:predicted ATP-dependent endonuclease of OLD family
MHIQNAVVKNFRNFENLSVTLSPLTILAGENDAGKSNFLYAISLPLYGSSPDFNHKRLSISDINNQCIRRYYIAVAAGQSDDDCKKLIPRVSVTLQFNDTHDAYELAIVSKWLMDNHGAPAYEIEYSFKPRNDEDFLAATKAMLKDQDAAKMGFLSFPIELYEYEITSPNNGKDIPQADLKHVIVSNIGAERDSFAESTTARSNNLLTKILLSSLQETEKKSINSAYGEFFAAIKEAKIFGTVFKFDDAFENISKYFDELHCIPNLPNLRNIISNITLGYGEQFLYQKGLGERNMVLIFLLFAYYKTTHKAFNLCCIEEPEAHLSVNNLRLTVDYIAKSSTLVGGLLQTIVSTHNPSIINKLNIKNVVVFSGGKAISLSSASEELQNYLSKRPNFDILKLLFSRRTILVEGPTEEMLINTFLGADNKKLSDIEVIAIGQKGFKTFLDIWLHLNVGQSEKKIGIVRDFDNQPKAKAEHDAYDNKHANIVVRTTQGYTLEDDLASHPGNSKALAEALGQADDAQLLADFMKSAKTDWMLTACNYIVDPKAKHQVTLPHHIEQVIGALS